MLWSHRLKPIAKLMQVDVCIHVHCTFELTQLQFDKTLQLMFFYPASFNVLQKFSQTWYFYNQTRLVLHFMTSEGNLNENMRALWQIISMIKLSILIPIPLFYSDYNTIIEVLL